VPSLSGQSLRGQPCYRVTSLGVTCFPARRVAGFSDMSRLSFIPHGMMGQVGYLPDKEFRYLRTVIVTAAVHRGFGSELRLR